MRLLTLSQIRFLRFAPWSTLTVLIGVALAVCSIVAVHQVSRRVVDSLAAVIPPHLEDVSYLLDRPDMSMEDYFELRERWRAGGIPEVVGLMPLVSGTARTPHRTLRLVGVDGFSGVPAVAGLALVPPDNVVVGPGLGMVADDLLVMNGRALKVAFVHAAVPEDTAVTDIGTAQVVLGRPAGALDRIAVVVASERERLAQWADRLLPGFSAGLTLPVWSLPGWRVETLEAALPELAFARSVLFNLGALGSLALVVAWLLVHQVSVIWLRRRHLTLTRLSQMGASDGELLWGFLASLLGLGCVACLVGLPAGDALARGLSRLVTGYADAAGRAPGLDGWVTIKAFASAVVVCGAGGFFAFRRESGAPPSPVRQWLLVSGLLLLGLMGLVGTDSLLGGFVTIGAVSMLVLLSIGPGLRGLRRMSRRLGGSLLLRSGVRELVWYPGDLAVAVGALVLALATSVAIAAMVDSFRADFERMLDQRLAYDLFIDGQGRDLGKLADSLAELPDVTRLQRYGGGEMLLAGRQVSVSFTRFDARESRRYGLDGPLPPGSCVVSERLARALDLGVGDVLAEPALTVAGIFPGFGDAVPRLLLGEADAVRLGLIPRYDRLSVDTPRPDQVSGRIEALDGAVSVQPRGAVRARALSIFDQTFAITGALTTLALLVAAVGLYNALLALELLRQRTRILLDALGVFARERRRIDGGRTLAVCLLVVVLALPLGLVMGLLLCEVINPRAFGWSLTLSPGSGALAWPVALALGVMALVALLPVPAEELPDVE